MPSGLDRHGPRELAVFATMAASGGRAAAEFDGVTVRINSYGGGFDQVLKDCGHLTEAEVPDDVPYEPGTSSRPSS